MNNHDKSRRSFIKKAAYIAPVVLTLKAGPTMAYSYGSVQNCPTGGYNNDGSEYDKKKRH